LRLSHCLKLHAHVHNINMHPRDRYLIKATTGQGC